MFSALTVMIRTKCPHSFSKDAIMGMFTQNRGALSVKCPATGCSASLTKSDLKPNKELEARAKAYERRMREKEREEHEAVEEVEIDDD